MLELILQSEAKKDRRWFLYQGTLKSYSNKGSLKSKKSLRCKGINFKSVIPGTQKAMKTFWYFTDWSFVGYLGGIHAIGEISLPWILETNWPAFTFWVLWPFSKWQKLGHGVRPDMKLTGDWAVGGLAWNLYGLLSVSAENKGIGETLYIQHSDLTLAKMSNKGLHDKIYYLTPSVSHDNSLFFFTTLPTFFLSFFLSFHRRKWKKK